MTDDPEDALPPDGADGSHDQQDQQPPPADAAPQDSAPDADAPHVSVGSLFPPEVEVEPTADDLTPRGQLKQSFLREVQRLKRHKNATHPRVIADRQRAMDAMRYRAMGYNYADIAALCGYADFKCAQRAVQRALALHSQEAADVLLANEQARLSLLAQTAMSAAVQGDLNGVASALQVHDRIVRLLGIGAPQKVALTTPDGKKAAPPSVMGFDMAALMEKALAHKAQSETQGGE